MEITKAPQAVDPGVPKILSGDHFIPAIKFPVLAPRFPVALK
jgi:hypothetical protein